VARTIREACTTEVVATAVAMRALEGAEDEQARSALARICEDEARHAELAYRFVVWAMRTGGEAVHDAARRAFEAALGEAGEAGAAIDDDEILLGRHGQLSLGLRAEVDREARATLLVPLRDAVLSCRTCDDGRPRVAHPSASSATCT
jgi:hypothetical protein